MINFVTPIQESVDAVLHLDELLSVGNIMWPMTNAQAKEMHVTRYHALRNIASHVLGEMERSRRYAGIELAPSKFQHLLSEVTDPEEHLRRLHE